MAKNKDIYLYSIVFWSNFDIATTMFGIPLGITSTVLIFLFILLYITANHFKIEVITDIFHKQILCFMILPVITGFLIIPINSFVLYSLNYSFDQVIYALPRIANYLEITLILVFLFKKIETKSIFIVKAFYISLIIFLIFGIWQLLNYYFNVPIISFETRNSLHSVADNYGWSRITSIAREPSFYAPLFIETILLSLFLKEVENKRRYLYTCIIAIIVGCYTFSPSFFLELFILYFISILKTKRHIIIACIFTLVLAIIITHTELYDYLDRFIFSRFEDAGDSTRFLQIKSVVETFENSNLLVLIFGYGIKGFHYLSEIITIDSTGEKLHHTSNNIFVDMAVDEGIVGIVCFLCLLYLLYSKAKQIKCSRIPLYYVLHFLLYNQYRGEYAAPRFVIEIALILIICNYYSRIQKQRPTETCCEPLNAS